MAVRITSALDSDTVPFVPLRRIMPLPQAVASALAARTPETPQRERATRLEALVVNPPRVWSGWALQRAARRWLALLRARGAVCDAAVLCELLLARDVDTNPVVEPASAATPLANAVTTAATALSLRHLFSVRSVLLKAILYFLFQLY